MTLALSIRQPWAWLILNAGKDVENRSWSTPVRGRILLHASKTITRDDYKDAWDFADGIAGAVPGAPKPDWPTWRWFKDNETGGIVGEAEIVDCVARSDSPWFVGQFGFVLRNARPLPFRPYKGVLGFFEVPE